MVGEPELEAKAPTHRSAILGQPLHLLDYVRVLSKRRASVLTVYGLALAAGFVYVLAATPIYEAKAQLLIDPQPLHVVNFKEVTDQDRTSIEYYQTQYRLLRSRALAKKTIDGLGLGNRPDFRSRGQSDLPRIWQVVVRNITAAFEQPGDEAGTASQAGEAPAAGALPSPDEDQIVDTFLAHLSVAPVRGSRLVDVRFRSPDPALAAKVVNALAKAYLDQALEFRFLSSKQASDWLAERLAEQRKQVEASEQALQRYREENDALSLEERQNIVVQKLADLNAAVTRAKTQRIEKEAQYRQLRVIARDRVALDTFPAVLANSFIQQLKSELVALQQQQTQLGERYGGRHPEMVRLESAIRASQAKLQAETDKVAQSVRNEYLAAQAQEASLNEALEAQKREAMDLNKKAIDYGMLQRGALSNRQIFDSLLQRVKETGVSGELRTSNIRIIDPAEIPIAPVSPDKFLTFVIAVFGGAVLAIGLAFFFEYLDTEIKSPDELKAYLGLPMLGFVPMVHRHSSDALLINNGVPARFAEAFKTLRTSVLFSSERQQTRTLLVTSTRSGEGKTIVAGNLALALAQAGQRVILIDADMRHPKVHDLFGTSRAPGLSNLIVGDAKVSRCVRRPSVDRLCILPAGVIPPNPAELLGSQRLKELVKALGGYFDWLVIDSPPALAVTDAAILAHVATDLLFVVGADMTDRRAAQSALEHLRTSEASFLGGVLNMVDVDHDHYYYFPYSGSRYYDYGQASSLARSAR